MRKNTKRHIKKLMISEIIFKSTLFVFLLILISLYMASGILAKYKSESFTSDGARVAKFGQLSFYEYTVDGGTLVGDTTEVETVIVTAGEDIEKKISLSFSDSEVATYIFFVVETSGWSITTDTNSNTNRLSVKNAGGEDMIYWDLSSNWTYIESVSNDEKFVFYHLVEPNVNFVEDVMTELIVHSISLDDVILLKSPGYSLSFKTYALSASGVTPKEAFERIK